MTLVSSSAQAYRPFDGTDADTAELGNFELELGPAHFYAVGNRNYLIAPDSVLNFGILPDTELVIDSKDFLAMGPLAGRPRAALLDTDVFLKHIFREGILQGKPGISIAAEGGLLTPEINGTNAFGASLDVIFSYRWDWGTVHFNEQVQYTRERNLDLFSNVIVEGPHDWTVRPVSEIYYEREYNVMETWSALAGVIWTLRESFVIDAAVRGALVGDQRAVEIRLGLTWALPL